MSEVIRWARDRCNLGGIFFAFSDDGLVGLEFDDRRGDMESALRLRFPQARIIAEQNGLAGDAAKLREMIEEPGVDHGIPLDPRGTPFQMSVWQLLGNIPMGETSHYGALAAELGTRDARPVTEAIAANSIAILVPCHRVIKKDGSISGYRWGTRRKRTLLQREQAAVRERLAAILDLAAEAERPLPMLT